MAPSVLALIGATIVFTSFLSGVFGMAGGMILLGVLLNYFDVASGMILFSIIQLFANGWRVVQWRGYVLWPIFGWDVAGAALSVVGMWEHALVAFQATLFLPPRFVPFWQQHLLFAPPPPLPLRGGAICTLYRNQQR